MLGQMMVSSALGLFIVTCQFRINYMWLGNSILRCVAWSSGDSGLQEEAFLRAQIQIISSTFPKMNIHDLLTSDSLPKEARRRSTSSSAGEPLGEANSESTPGTYSHEKPAGSGASLLSPASSNPLSTPQTTIHATIHENGAQQLATPLTSQDSIAVPVIATSEVGAPAPPASTPPKPAGRVKHAVRKVVSVFS